MKEVFEAIGAFATVAAAIGCCFALFWYFFTTISNVRSIERLERKGHEETRAREDLERRVGNLERRMTSVDATLARVEGRLAECNDEREALARRIVVLEHGLKSAQDTVQKLMDEAPAAAKREVEDSKQRASEKAIDDAYADKPARARGI